MAIFQTRIRHVTLTWSPFSSEQMSSIGSVWIDAKLSRIRQAIDSTDSPSKPLTPRYKAEKTGDDGRHGRRVYGSGNQRFMGKGVRDWKLRGWTLASAKVKVASEDKVTIGFINDQANKIITGQRRLNDMWADSPKDMEAVYAAVRASLTQHMARSIRKSA